MHGLQSYPCNPDLKCIDEALLFLVSPFVKAQSTSGSSALPALACGGAVAAAAVATQRTGGLVSFCQHGLSVSVKTVKIVKMFSSC